MTKTKQTNEQRLQGIDPRLLDRLWRLENLYWIEDKDGKVVKFKLNSQQKELFDTMHLRNIILKARQLGMSTFIAILFLDDCLFNKNMKAAIVADKLENGKKIFKKIEFAWNKFPKQLKEALGLECNSDSTSEMTWTNSSSFNVGTTIHAGTYQRLHISEYGPLCAHLPEKAADIKKSALPTVKDGTGLVFIESTAEGEGNEFHQMYLDAQESWQRTTDHAISNMEYKPFFFPWHQEPQYAMEGDNVKIPRDVEKYLDDLERDLHIKLSKGQRNWYYFKGKEMKDEMKSQYPSFPDEAFKATGGKQFDGQVLDHKLLTEVKDPVMIVDDMLIFKTYRAGHVYGIGADVADGVGKDSSTAVCIDFTKNEVVATYKSNSIDPVTFAETVLAKMGFMYGACLVAPENARTGHTTCVTLKNCYPNVYQYEILGMEEVKRTTRLGWSTNVSTKPRMMNDLAQAFGDEDKPLLVPDASILREARLYTKVDNLSSAEMQARSTRHFDLLIAAAIAWQLRNEAGQGIYSDPRTEHHVRELHTMTEAGRRRFG
jgi:hypothetical protein